MDNELATEAVACESAIDGRWAEDLAWEARRGLELARRLCRCDGAYHALWGTLRASGFMGGIAGEEKALSQVLSPYIGDGTRILVGGSADPATFCAIGRTADHYKPHVTIIDKCRAPLQLIEEFATGRGLSCATLHSDLLNLDGSTTWDVIVLHYTASFVSPDLRKCFFERLAKSLSHGGTLVCTALTAEKRWGGSDGERRKLEALWFDRAKARIIASGFDSRWNGDDLDTALWNYAVARTVRRLNITTAAEIRGLLRAAGLSISAEVTTERKWMLRAPDPREGDMESSIIVTATRS